MDQHQLVGSLSHIVFNMTPLRMDIFPKYVLDHVDKLVYPGKKFEFFKNDGPCHIFITYMDTCNRIYYCNLDWTDQYLSHMIRVGKDSQTCNEFRPESINWENVLKKLERDTNQDYKKNSDGRIGFKNGTRFLVKANFTFGYRTVEPGTVHLIQTLNVPLVFYLNTKELSIDKGILPCATMNSFERRVLLSNGCYRIPPGTGYILFSTQKNFFSLDVIRDTAPINIPYTDPVKNKVTRIVDIYDKPLKTPYIDDLHASKNQDKPLKTPYIDDTSKNQDLDLLYESIQPSTDPTYHEMQQSECPQEATFHETPQDVVFLKPFPVQQTTFMEPPQEATFQNLTNKRKTFPSMHQEPFKRQKMQQETLKNDDLTLFDQNVEYFLNREIFYNQSSEPGWRRNIVVANLEFPKYYQMLADKQMGDPRLSAPVNSEVCYPLDLSMKTTANEHLNDQHNELPDEMDLSNSLAPQINNELPELNGLGSLTEQINPTYQHNELPELNGMDLRQINNETPNYHHNELPDGMDLRQINNEIPNYQHNELPELSEMDLFNSLGPQTDQNNDFFNLDLNEISDLEMNDEQVNDIIMELYNSKFI